MQYHCIVCKNYFFDKETYINHIRSNIHLDRFNKEQKELIQCIRDDKTKSILCNSAGGCGKTFTLACNICPEDVLYITPSNTACKVIREHGQKNVTTFAKAFGWGQDYNEEGKEFSIYKLNTRQDFEKFKIIVVDEVSMLNEVSYSLFYKYIHSANIPYILLGDECQLAPIPDQIKPRLDEDVKIFKADNDKSLFFSHTVDKTVTLIENKRLTNPDNPIKKYIEYARKCVKKGIYVNIKANFTITEESILIFKNTDTMFLSFTNDVKDQMNKFIRKIYHPNQKNEWNLGEKIIIDKSFKGENLLYNGGSSDDPDCKYPYTFLNTAEIYNITDIVKISKTIEDINFDVYKIVLNNKIRIYKIANSDKNKLSEFIKDKITEIKNIDDIDKRKKSFREFYQNVLPQLDCNITYCYCITVYKSQGSSFENTVILQEDFPTNQIKINNRNRLVYTAVSRSREKCYIVSNKIKYATNKEPKKLII